MAAEVLGLCTARQGESESEMEALLILIASVRNLVFFCICSDQKSEINYNVEFELVLIIDCNDVANISSYISFNLLYIVKF